MPNPFDPFPMSPLIWEVLSQASGSISALMSTTTAPAATLTMDSGGVSDPSGSSHDSSRFVDSYTSQTLIADWNVDPFTSGQDIGPFTDEGSAVTVAFVVDEGSLPEREGSELGGVDGLFHVDPSDISSGGELPLYIDPLPAPPLIAPPLPPNVGPPQERPALPPEAPQLPPEAPPSAPQGPAPAVPVDNADGMGFPQGPWTDSAGD